MPRSLVKDILEEIEKRMGSYVKNNIFLISKVFTYIKLWGIRQTFFKVCGRSRPLFIRFPGWIKKEIAIIGCGKFSYNILGPRLLKFGIFSPIFYAYDHNKKNLNSFCRAYSCKKISNFPNEELDKKIKLVYVCTSHSSHFYYICHFLESGIDIYSEKPLTTQASQVFELASKCSKTSARLYSGYNRPHSPAITKLRSAIKKYSPVNQNIICTVKGHHIKKDHWYRRSGEGGMIYGNLSHWIDLCVHMIFWSNKLPDKISISISYFDSVVHDENFLCKLDIGNGFVFSIYFFSLMEPFTGINENIEFISEKFHAKIDDFKSLEMDFGTSKSKIFFSPKSVGYEESIKQPNSTDARDIREYFISELICAEIFLAISNKREISRFDFSENIKKLNTILA